MDCIECCSYYKTICFTQSNISSLIGRVHYVHLNPAPRLASEILKLVVWILIEKVVGILYNNN